TVSRTCVKCVFVSIRARLSGTGFPLFFFSVPVASGVSYSIKCVKVVGAINVDSEGRCGGCLVRSAHQADGTSRRSRPNVATRQEAGGGRSRYA
ncbi:hypothetical protein F5879DRAFT_981018, partial [Lentinula edodes]